MIGIVVLAAAFLTPSQVIAQADALDGKTIRIGGVVDLGTNSRCLWDSMKAYRGRGSDWTNVITLSEGAKIWQRRATINHRFVIIEGILRRHFNEPDVIDLWQCNDVGVEQVSIRPYTPTTSSRAAAERRLSSPPSRRQT